MSKKKKPEPSAQDKLATEWHTMTMACLAVCATKMNANFGLPDEGHEIMIMVPEITEVMQRSFQMYFTEDKLAVVVKVGPPNSARSEDEEQED